MWFQAERSAYWRVFLGAMDKVEPEVDLPRKPTGGMLLDINSLYGTFTPEE
jgi:hypothetical protein